MSEAASLEAFEAELGEGCLRTDPLEIDGFRIERRIEPADGEALARALRALAAHRLRALVRGRGSLDELGNPLRAADVVLSTRGLDGIDELAIDEGVVRVRAGTPLARLRREIEAEGWEIPLDPPGDASVGGAIAAASCGPLQLAYGPPRDAVLGLDVVLASGERTRCGGRVVKNVTGYDLAKLYTGSHGSLGVIEAAWLRLRPRPERSVALAASLGARLPASALAVEVSRRTSARCAALLSTRIAEELGVAHPELWSLFVVFAGRSEEVERDAEWLAERASASVAPDDALARVAAAQSRSPGDGGLRARLALLPSACSLALAPLREAGAHVVAHPGVGLVYAIWQQQDLSGAAVAQALRTVDEAARRARAQVRLEALPRALKQQRDVFGELGATLPIMRALKQRFDPTGMLNPGRFAGRL